jgi:hypothetical protein
MSEKDPTNELERISAMLSPDTPDAEMYTVRKLLDAVLIRHTPLRGIDYCWWMFIEWRLRYLEGCFDDEVEWYGTLEDFLQGQLIVE